MSWFQQPNNSPLNPAATEFVPPSSHMNGKTKPIQWTMEEGVEADDPSSNVLNGKLSFEEQYAFLWGDEKQKNNTPEDQPQFSEDQFSFLWEEQLSLDQIKNIPISNDTKNGDAPNNIKKENVEEGHTFLWEKGRNSLRGSASNIPVMPPISGFIENQLTSSAPMPIHQNGHNVKTIPFVMSPSNMNNSALSGNANHKRNNSSGGSLGASFSSLTFGTPPSTSPTPNGFVIQSQWGKEVGSPNMQSSSWKPPSKSDAKLIPNMPAPNSWDGTRSQAIPVKPVNKEVYSYNSLDKSVGSPSSPKFPVQFSPEKITFLQNLSSSPADMNAIKMNPIEFLESIFIGCDREFLIQALEVNEFDIKKTTQYLLRGIKNPEEAAMIISSTPPSEKPPVKVPEQPKKKKDEQAPVCKYFLKGSCLIKNCPFRHTTEVACKYWLRGFCSRGDQCDYKHSVDIAAINRVFEGIEEVSTGEYRDNDKSKISLSQQEFPSLKNVSKK